MLLVMDKIESWRAMELRKRILKMGFPCAVSFPPFAVDHLRPVLCILTFADAVDVIRRSPLDDVPALAIGSGFVNSLMNTKLFETEEEMLSFMEDYITSELCIQPKLYYGIPGHMLPSGFILTKLQIYYRLFSLDLTEREQRILRTILYAPDHPHTYRNIEAYAFPYPYKDTVFDIENTITAQISSINRKAIKNAGRKILRYNKAGSDNGYILHITKPPKKNRL